MVALIIFPTITHQHEEAGSKEDVGRKEKKKGGGAVCLVKMVKMNNSFHKGPESCEFKDRDSQSPHPVTETEERDYCKTE